MPRTGKKSTVKGGQKTTKKAKKIVESSDSDVSDSSSVSSESVKPVKKVVKKVAKKPTKKVEKKPMPKTKKQILESSSESSEESISGSEESQAESSESSESSSEEVQKTKKIVKKSMVQEKKTTSESSKKQERELMSENFKKNLQEMSEQIRQLYISNISDVLLMESDSLFLEMPFEKFSSLVDLYMNQLRKKGNEEQVSLLRKKFGIIDIGPKPEKTEPPKKEVKKQKTPEKPSESLKEPEVEELDIEEDEREELFKSLEDNMESEEGTVEPIGAIERELKKIEEPIKLTEKEIKDLLTFSTKNLTDQEIATRAGVDMEKVLYFQNNLESIKKNNPRLVAQVETRRKAIL